MPQSKSSQGPGTTGAASSAAGGSVKADALRLLALDEVDLTILATHLQDAVGRVRDMAFVPKNKRFALILNRFNWTAAERAASTAKPTTFERRRCGLRFEHVKAARTSGFSQRDKKQVLSLLTISYEKMREGEPDGTITLLFAGGGAIRLEVECIEAELRDIGSGWRTSGKPEHPEF